VRIEAVRTPIRAASPSMRGTMMLNASSLRMVRLAMGAICRPYDTARVNPSRRLTCSLM